MRSTEILATIRLLRWLACVSACLLLYALDGRVAAQERGEPLVRGLIALHYFEYEEANEAFREARVKDPASVMACWGEAMTYHQTLWRNENVGSARQALARLGPTPAARAAKARTPKELMLLTTAETLFGDGDAPTRQRRYADAMGQLYAREPDDPDVASLYALALLGTMSRSLIGYVDAHEGHSQTLAGSDTQRQVATILEKVLRSHPDHPGALHYLLHNDDDPAHAQQALGAARALAKIAPDSSHALHMPSHIFVQLGLWQDAASSDAAAFKASEAWVARKRLPAALRNYHALSWLEYELLQQGRYREARDAIAEIEPVVKATGQLALLSDLSTMRARYVIETSSWNLMAQETNFGNVDELFAIGMSAARTGNAGVAERVRQALAARAHDEREGDLRPAIAIMEREIASLIAFAGGRRDEALTILEAAAKAERQLPPPLGLPEPIKPAPELLGEMLIDAGRQRDASPFFRQALERNANRSLSVLGLARAAAATGETSDARQHYRQLLANFNAANADIELLKEVRRAVDEAPATQTSRSRPVVFVGPALALAAATAAGLLLRRRATERRARELRSRK
jgi:tetratricopeptide (TPR) repeat protein